LAVLPDAALHGSTLTIDYATIAAATSAADLDGDGLVVFDHGGAGGQRDAVDHEGRGDLGGDTGHDRTWRRATR